MLDNIRLRGFIICLLAATSLVLPARTAYALPFICVANAAVPPTVRSEGLAELVGDIVLDCTGGVAGTPMTVDLRVFLNAEVSSRILSLPATAEALLLIDEPAPAAQALGINVFQGVVFSGNSISWPNISFSAPGDFSHRIFRFANLRVNANGVAGAPPVIQALVSSSGNVSMPIVNPTLVVAFCQKGLNFSAMGVNFDRSFAPGDGGNPSQFSITFGEGFPTAFKQRIQGQFQDIPGLIYQTESGFTSGISGAAGVADTGTRLVARFSNVPAGVSLSVPVTVTSGASTAVLMSGVAQDLSGGTPALSGDIVLNGGSGTAVWEITGTNPLAAENIAVPVTVSYTPGVAGGIAYVSGGLGPVGTGASASATDPLPRFVAQAGAVAAFQIPISVPALGGWGMLIFMLVAGLLSVFRLRKESRR